jgi:hypothetical protein
VDRLQNCDSSSHITHLSKKLPIHYGEQNRAGHFENNEWESNMRTPEQLTHIKILLEMAPRWCHKTGRCRRRKRLEIVNSFENKFKKPTRNFSDNFETFIFVLSNLCCAGNLNQDYVNST